jgi:hypothetical protein
MKKAIIYIPNKNPMQSGLAKSNNWVLEFKTKDPTKNPLMGWESSSDTYSELKLEFSSKALVFMVVVWFSNNFIFSLDTG